MMRLYAIDSSSKGHILHTDFTRIHVAISHALGRLIRLLWLL